MLDTKHKKLDKTNRRGTMSEEAEPIWPLLLVAATLAVATFSLSLSVEWWGNTVYRSALICVLVLTVVADLQLVRNHYKKTGGMPKSDERLDKVIVYASAYAFRVGICLMVVLIFLQVLTATRVNSVAALSVTMLVMTGSYLASSLYFERKGDVQ